MKSDRAEFEIVIRDQGDPIADRTGHTRDAAYRLKLLLKAIGRGYGFRAVRVVPVEATKGEPVTAD